jgi:hypothetical protein
MATSTQSAGSAVNGSGGGSTNWTDLGNVTTSDDNYVRFFAQSDGDSSKDLDCTNFGFSIPAGATINGIQANIERNGFDITDLSIKLLNGDGAGGESAQDKSLGASWSNSDTVDSFGGSTDTWGETWSVSDVNSSNFGIRIQCQDNAGGFPQVGGSANIDHVEITVYYTASGPNFEVKAGTVTVSDIKLGEVSIADIFFGTIDL